jgi:hypothetical protein
MFNETPANDPAPAKISRRLISSILSVRQERRSMGLLKPKPEFLLT